MMNLNDLFSLNFDNEHSYTFTIYLMFYTDICTL